MRDDAQLEVLSVDECRRLLAEALVGWLAFCDGDRPALAPVNYIVHLGEIVARSDYGAKLAAAAHDRLMSLGVGGIDAQTRTGWSVQVTGRARLLGDDLVNPDLPEPDSWAVDGPGVRIGIPIEEISGRRVVRAG
ncbi:pyridoxamine 5'-phosphate oxidase family protein [Georgenia subflava]|nr:pyridoxamine 5'-phosphate oxidase family protein [Georgenia subflava]